MTFSRVSGRNPVSEERARIDSLSGLIGLCTADQTLREDEIPLLDHRSTPLAAQEVLRRFWSMLFEPLQVVRGDEELSAKALQEPTHGGP
jgi:hypothetical protein